MRFGVSFRGCLIGLTGMFARSHGIYNHIDLPSTESPSVRTETISAWRDPCGKEPASSTPTTTMPTTKLVDSGRAQTAGMIYLLMDSFSVVNLPTDSIIRSYLLLNVFLPLLPRVSCSV